MIQIVFPIKMANVYNVHINLYSTKLEYVQLFIPTVKHGKKSQEHVHHVLMDMI